jgi:hypothetical protein
MPLLECFDELFSNFRPHFKQEETFQRARSLAYASIVTYGRRTITRLICSKNEHHKDWSADYRFFSERQWDPNNLFSEILNQCVPYSHWYQDAILTAMDSTIRKKTGKKIPGVRILRDPMSPPYHVNLTPGLRLLQASTIITPGQDVSTFRAIPNYFEIIPPAKKPRKNAPQEVKEQYKKEQKANRLGIRGHEAAISIRQQVDKLPNGKDRLLFIPVDGGFANRGFLRNQPDNIVSIARVRKDLKIFKPADDSASNPKCKRRVYGERLPTPEEIRKDDATPPDCHSAIAL